MRPKMFSHSVITASVLFAGAAVIGSAAGCAAAPSVTTVSAVPRAIEVAPSIAKATSTLYLRDGDASLKPPGNVAGVVSGQSALDATSRRATHLSASPGASATYGLWTDKSVGTIDPKTGDITPRYVDKPVWLIHYSNALVSTPQSDEKSVPARGDVYFLVSADNGQLLAEFS